VRRSFPADWPYLKRTYEKRAELAAACTVTHRSTSRLILSHPTRISRTARDSSIERANPDIGLYEDPLELPADEPMLRGLLDQAGAELSQEVHVAVIEDRLAEVRAHADALVRAGDPAEALEAYADYVCLLEEVRPEEAARVRVALTPRLLWAAGSP
jgi:hypothetical protein